MPGTHTLRSRSKCMQFTHPWNVSVPARILPSAVVEKNLEKIDSRYREFAAIRIVQVGANRIVSIARPDILENFNIQNGRIMIKRHQRKRTLRLESLEHRELMATDVTASYTRDTGELKINGTERADDVTIWTFQGMTYARSMRGLNITTFFSGPSSDIKSIVVDMKGGQDKIVFNMGNTRIDQIHVNMGVGGLGTLSNRELADFRGSNVGKVKINAEASYGTNVLFQGLNASEVEAFFGTDNAADGLLVKQSSIGKLEAKLGGGDDVFNVAFSSIRTAAVHLEAGNDKFIIETVHSEIANGFVDGGSGVDDYQKKGRPSPGGVRIRSFER
jgi:hypothetical protein